MICRLCHNSSTSLAIDFGQQPIVHKLYRDKKESYEKYSFQLGSCSECGFLQLLNPIPADILYQNYFTVSAWKNQPHVNNLIRVLENIAGKNNQNEILDIGCNDGSFLKALKKQGYSRLFGIEPTTDSFILSQEDSLDVHHGFFDQNLAKDFYGKNRFDIVTTRHVLEHIMNLDDFLLGIKLVLKEDGILMIEVPDSKWNLEYLDYALWEEHVNYFTINTLYSLLKKHSFDIIHYETTLFSGRSLTVYCKKSKQESKSIKYKCVDKHLIEGYIEKWDDYRKNLNDFISEIDGPIAMYGCGARSSNFINFTKLHDKVECFIDDQDEKQNLFVPGSDLKVYPWDNKKFSEYFFLLGVNAENEFKVINNRNINKKRCVSISPPSRHLPDFWIKMLD